MRSPLDDRTHALYRFYGDDGALLYVGMTVNPGARWPQHEADKTWWHEVRGITRELYPDRDSVRAAEALAITVENPRYNLQRPRARRRTPTPPRPQIVWLCNVCGDPIENGQGYLEVDLRAVFRVEAWWREHRQNNPQGKPVDIDALLSGPEPVRWLAHHADCDSDPDYSGYWFDIHRARTHAQLLNWTAHLMEKSWLEYTNWSDLIRRLAGVDA